MKDTVENIFKRRIQWYYSFFKKIRFHITNEEKVSGLIPLYWETLGSQQVVKLVQQGFKYEITARLGQKGDSDGSTFYLLIQRCPLL